MKAAASSARRCPSSAAASKRTSSAANSAATPCSPRSCGCSTQEHIRVGNEEYARDNDSFGATTLRGRHVRSKGGKMMMRFNGKHGIVHEATITDASLKRIVKQCQDLPGQMLFQYINGDGEPQAINSADVNAYIRDATGGDFTAKHFRTWGASVIAFEQLLQGRRGPRQPQDGDRAGRRSARQHRRDEPQVLCPPGADRRAQGPTRAIRLRGMKRPRGAHVGCPPPKSACSSSSRRSKRARSEADRLA